MGKRRRACKGGQEGMGRASERKSKKDDVQNLNHENEEVKWKAGGEGWREVFKEKMM